MTQLFTRNDMHPTFSLPSILAIVCAIGSFMVAPGWQLVLAILAAVFGIVGFLVSLSPAKRGGIISVLSIAIAAIALITAVIRIIGYVARSA